MSLSKFCLVYTLLYPLGIFPAVPLEQHQELSIQSMKTPICSTASWKCLGFNFFKQDNIGLWICRSSCVTSLFLAIFLYSLLAFLS